MESFIATENKIKEQLRFTLAVSMSDLCDMAWNMRHIGKLSIWIYGFVHNDDNFSDDTSLRHSTLVAAKRFFSTTNFFRKLFFFFKSFCESRFSLHEKFCGEKSFKSNFYAERERIALEISIRAC